MSEFGRGYAYPLGLFLAHAERICEYQRAGVEEGPWLWFQGAADHLKELKIPDKIAGERRQEIEQWVTKCLYFHDVLSGATCAFDDCFAAVAYAKELLRDWDQLNGIESAKAECA